MIPLLAALVLSSTHALQVPETPKQRDTRLRWWREARFGMFIHWGLYAVPAGEWHGQYLSPGGGEWILNNAQIPRGDYDKFATEWNPTRFDAHEWVSLAKEAGMKYIVITSKHHDGFGLWPSKAGDWNVGRTPFHRDPLNELASECKEQGIKLCFYYSIMDWHHPDYLPKRDWDHAGEEKANFERYVAYMKAQLKELLTNYGDIGVLWFDGEFEGTWTHERGVDLYNFVRTIQPKLIVNNRVDKNGHDHTDTEGNAGDFGTPEQTIPPNGLPALDWESCMTMNDTWGYRRDDHDWKSAQSLVRYLIDCASKGGNYLLNVGPRPDGAFPAESVRLLKEIGRWTKLNGDAIYGTKASPFSTSLPWGRVTRKGNRLFLHVFDAGDRVLLPTPPEAVSRVKTLVGGRPLKFNKSAGGIDISLAGIPRDPYATVIEVDLAGRIR